MKVRLVGGPADGREVDVEPGWKFTMFRHVVPRRIVPSERLWEELQREFGITPPLEMEVAAIYEPDESGQWRFRENVPQTETSQP